MMDETNQVRMNVWRSSPGTTAGRHQLTVVKDGLLVTRMHSFPEQPDRKPRVQVIDAPTEERANIMFDVWSSMSPASGYRLIESCENPKR